MGYQNNTTPIAVYGCIDTCSRKMENRSGGFIAPLSPTASWGHGSSGDSHVWATNFQSSMYTFCVMQCFSRSKVFDVCRHVLPFVLVIKNNIETPSGQYDGIPNLQGSLIYIHSH